jgi:hypothetical protein
VEILIYAIHAVKYVRVYETSLIHHDIEPNVFIVIRFLSLAHVTFDTCTCRTDARAHVVPTGD